MSCKNHDRVRNLRTAIHLALLSSAIGAIAPARAQETSGTPETVEEIVVTGSRIARPDYTAASPVVSVGADVFNRVAAATPEQVLNTLPQFVPNITSNNNNPGNGQSNIDLRGLGTNRNLVLLNNRRLPASNADGTVDINIIPTALIKDVQILTGGASAVYGSDAIAGVTNFILRDDFEGVELNSTFGLTDESDGQEWTANITMGGNFADDRGNAVVHVGYTERELVRQGAREFSFLDLDVRRQGNTPGGSATIEQGRILSNSTNLANQAVIDSVFSQYQGYVPGSVTPSRALGTNPDGTLFSQGNGTTNSVVNFTGERDASFNPDAYSYNFAPPNLLQLPIERWNLAAFMNYDLTDNVNAYFSALYTTYGADTNLAPTPATGLTVPVTNPFIPADLATILASRPDGDADFGFSRRMSEVGPRTDVFDVDVWQYTTGLKGTVGDGYYWDVYVSGSRVEERNTQGGDLSLQRIQELLEAPDGGVAICGGFNVFGSGNVSPGCAAYVTTYFTNLTTVEQVSAEATFGGRMFSMPAGDARFSVGAAYREDSYDFEPDSSVASGDLVGFNQQNPLSGSINATELFAEALFPLLRDAPAAQRLDVTLGYRWSDYNLSGAANAYKAEVDWQVVDAVRVRSSYQRAVRAPSIDELFSPPNQGFPPVLEDPCDITSTARTSGANADAANGGSDAIRQLCLQTGVAADVIDDYSYPFAQVETNAGGNPNLQEESADTITFGVVFDSPFSGAALENLRASIDYWMIEIDDAIVQTPGGEILLLCYGANGNNQSFDPNDPTCQVVDRSVYGDSTPVISAGITSNASKLETAGIDVQIDWGLDFGGAGRLATNFVYTYLDKYELSIREGLPVLDRKGQVSDTPGETLPEWKMLLNMDYYFLNDMFRIGARYRYLPAMDNKYMNYDNVTTVGTPDIDYLDLNASWYLTSSAELSLGVTNVTNQEPPLYTASIEMNTDPSTFDVLGRRYFARLNYKF